MSSTPTPAPSSRNSGLISPSVYGAAGPGDTDTEAARFLAEECAAAPGEILVLATGSTTNLAAAAARDEAFFRNAADFTLMGGITESLVINGRIMDELNFSCDADATFALLASGAPVTIATAQNCLPAHVTRERLSEAFTDDAWLMGAIDYWFADMGERYAWNGFRRSPGGRRGPSSNRSCLPPTSRSPSPSTRSSWPQATWNGRGPRRRRPSCPRPSSRIRPPTSPTPYRRLAAPVMLSLER